MSKPDKQDGVSRRARRPSRRGVLRSAMIIGVAAAGGAALLLPRRANAYYSGPVSDHFDGERFFNPGGLEPQSFRNLARLYTEETWAPWPAEAPSPFRDRPPPSVGGKVARIVLVGHASWLLQAGGRNILIDPHWSDRAGPTRFIGPRRINAPGIAFEDLPKIDTVIVTHNHYDHMDLPTIGRLWARDRPRIVTPLGNDSILRGAAPDLTAAVMDWGHTAEAGGDLKIHAVPTHHWSARGIRDRRHALWASFVLDTPAGRIYAVGDSGFGDGRTFREIGRQFPGITMALLPIGAYEPRWFMAGQHMNPDEAVQAFELSGARAALGHHWGTFRLTAEPREQPAADLAAALVKRAIAPARFHAAQPGEAREITEKA